MKKIINVWISENIFCWSGSSSWTFLTLCCRNFRCLYITMCASDKSKFVNYKPYLLPGGGARTSYMMVTRNFSAVLSEEGKAGTPVRVHVGSIVWSRSDNMRQTIRCGYARLYSSKTLFASPVRNLRRKRANFNLHSFFSFMATTDRHSKIFYSPVTQL